MKGGIFSPKARGGVRLTVIFFLLALLLPAASSVAAIEGALIHGRVLDVAGRPVAGAELQVFDSARVRRPADFLSAKSGPDGGYRVRVPAGKYWLVAIKRNDGRRFGPLGADDRHSGNPEVVELDLGEDLEMDFTILTLKEASLRDEKRNNSLVRLEGRVLDRHGRGVAMACVLADKGKFPRGIPDYVSAWSGDDGAYLLYLPKGSYNLGAVRVFPPPKGYRLPLTRLLKGDAHQDIRLTSDHLLAPGE